MKRFRSSGQLVLLHICAGCNSLVAYPRALAFAPDSSGANCTLHAACAEAARRWVWPNLRIDANGDVFVDPVKQAP